MIRARTIEQKQVRLNEIMNTTEHLFLTKSYHEITLTTIASALGWSRGNLYKYVNTKEEIFLELYLSKQNNFIEELKNTFELKKYDHHEFATKVSQCFNQHQLYLRYHSILTSIIETNVSIEKLADFKIKSNQQRLFFLELLALQCPNKSKKEIKQFFLTLMYQACGLHSHTHVTDQLIEAMKLANLEFYQDDFCELFSDFIIMCLNYQ